MKKNITPLALSLLLSTYVITHQASDRPTLHRAIEPARTTLDITVKGKTLRLYFSILAESLPYITAPETNASTLQSQLAALSGIATPEQTGLCTSTGYQVHQVNGGIQGFQSFSCERADALTQINLDLFTALPLLKEADVWLITEQWQSKQIRHYTQTAVLIKPGALL